MNELEKNNRIEKLLEETAEQTQPNLMFKAELEQKLRKAHKPRASFSLPRFHGFVPALTSILVLGALILFMVWLFQSIEPQHGNGNDFVCPVTQPNGSLPPHETVPSQYYLGNGELWTVLWPDGKVYMLPENQKADGSFDMKWGFYRGVTGPLTVEGHRLDADADPLRADIPDGYGDTGFQVTGLIFPTTGCWEVTAHVGDASLTFVTEVLFGEETPTPELGTPTISATETSLTFDYTVQNGDTCDFLAYKYNITVEDLLAANGLQSCDIFAGMRLKIPIKETAAQPTQTGGYDWRGTTLYLNAAMPDAPAEVKIYQAVPDQPATVDDVRAFTQRFNMNGSIYEVQGELPNTTNYLVVDGNRQLRIRSNGYFNYVTDNSAWSNNPFFMKNPNAETVINNFMQTYGFDFPYKVEYSDFFGAYLALPLTPDGYAVSFGFFNSRGILFYFNKNGLISVQANLPDYQEVTSANIISADEAFQALINPNSQIGINEGMTSSSQTEVQSWSRPRTLDTTVTVYGFLNSTGKSIDGGAPLITLDGMNVTGNTAGIASPLENTFVEATGQYHEENGVKTFIMESWKPYNGYQEGIQGSIAREGDQVTITTSDKVKLILPDFPSDVELPLANGFLTGVTKGDVFEWSTLDTRPTSGGGGGGGGNGFHKVNVSGTPVPFPTPTESPSIEQTSTPEPVEALRGIVSITIYTQPDGTQRKEYTFAVPYSYGGYLSLNGDGLEAFDAYNHRPVDVWGTITQDSSGIAILKVDRFEIPYPDLSFQLLKGSVSESSYNGEQIMLLTTQEGQIYTILYDTGSPVFDPSMEGRVEVLQVLAIPDETYAGHPSVRMFSYGPEINPKTGEQYPYTITADQPMVMPDNATSPGSVITATIEKIELVYFMPDPRYTTPDANAAPPYIQPAWKFTGHYSNGDQFELLIQALTEQFLLPEYEELPAPG